MLTARGEQHGVGRQDRQERKARQHVMRQLGLDALEHQPRPDDGGQGETNQWVAAILPRELDRGGEEETPRKERNQEEEQVIAGRSFVLLERLCHAVEHVMLERVEEPTGDAALHQDDPGQEDDENNQDGGQQLKKCRRPFGGRSRDR